MADSNFIPLGEKRRIPGVDGSEAPASVNPPPVTSTFVDAMGQPVHQQKVSGACHKCGFAGHLPYQCRNNMPVLVNGAQKSVVDVSSTSSDSSDDETPLTKRKEDKKLKKTSLKKLKKRLKKLKKKNKSRKRKRSSSGSSGNESDSAKRKKSKKAKKSRKHSSSSSSTD